MNSASLLAVIDGFRRRRVLLVGDLVADEYIQGRTDRVSREAPVLVVRYDGCEVRPGGGANAALNLASLGARVLAIGLVGTDAMGTTLRGRLRQSKVDVRGVLRVGGRATATKTRILAGDLHHNRQQVLRIDRETGAAPPRAVRVELARAPTDL